MNSLHNSTLPIGICKWTTSHQVTNIANNDAIGIENGPCSIVSHKLQLAVYYATEHLTTDLTAKMNGFTEVIDGNIHSECSFSTSNPFFDSPLHYYQETFNGIKVSDMSPEFPLLPEPYQIEKIRWNWSSRNVDSSHFNFDDHEDLLELYGLNEQDVQANDDEFCDSPTWPGKRFIQESELEYLTPMSASFKETDSSSEIDGTTIKGNILKNCSRCYMDSPRDCFCEIVSQAHEDRHENSASRIHYHQSFDNVSDTLSLPRIHNNTAYQHGNTASLKACGASGHSFGYFQEYPAIEIEKVRWNCSSRDVDSSCFHFGDYEELLKLYGLNEQDVQVNDDEFCNSPTWPGKE
ncbi:hypothetical protein CAEBREN_00178 [Caenorhabditis brenneri]|uniref:Uncharacterized protein n=1 Tax=Caenorhabditis brenneri TaxID=135651 RepID=G0NNN3_CAEBE|nr:hypothetical protein CAEBREN_00178 [Caenorhabditis brenneri]